MQVLKELIDNAIKFTHNGSIELHYSLAESKSLKHTNLLISIKDTGIGIDQNNVHEIFTVFKQIENSEFSKSGLGLGISISQKIVELMGGSLWAESKIGVGSTFYLSIPIL